MNGSHIIDTLQLVAGAAWLSVMLSRAFSVCRALAGRGTTWFDIFSLFLVGHGAVQLGFVLRWWLYPAAKRSMEPGEMTLWSCLYLASAMLALASHWIPRRG